MGIELYLYCYILSRKTPFTMKGQLVIVVFLASAILIGCQAQTTGRPTCPEIECPNEKPEGGMFARGDCLAEFCDCSYGTPYLLKCEDPLVFDEANQVCNWCYNMCDKCASDCGGCKK